MGHDHYHHNHSHDINPENVGQAFRWGIALNVTYVLIEFGYGFFTNSLALLADAGHNLSDVGSLALSLVAFRLARKKSTKKYTYGYRKGTVLASLANAVLLLIVVGGIGFEAINRFMHPQPSQGNIVAWVAAIGVVINAFSAWLFFKGKEHDLNVKGAYLHLLSDALVSVGVVITGIIIAYTNWQWLDPVISMVIMVVILTGTWGLLRESLALSMDGVPENIDRDEVILLIKNVPGVLEVNHVHIWAISTTENALTAHIGIAADMDMDEIGNLKHEIRHQLEHQKITHATLEMENVPINAAVKNCMQNHES